MQNNGIRTDQVTQVRGFADQNLRTPNDPFDPANRRISLIVRYSIKNGGDAEKSSVGEEDKSGEKSSSAHESAESKH